MKYVLQDWSQIRWTGPSEKWTVEEKYFLGDQSQKINFPEFFFTRLFPNKTILLGEKVGMGELAR